MYMWRGNPIVSHPSFTILCFVWLFSFHNHSCYVHAAQHSYHGWNPQDICTAKINYHQVVMSKEGGGGLSSSLCTYGRIYTIRQEKFLLFSILRYKINFFFKGLGGSSNWYSNVIIIASCIILIISNERYRVQRDLLLHCSFSNCMYYNHML